MLVHQSECSVSNTYHAVQYQSRRFGMHFHRGYEIIHAVKGSVELTVDGVAQKLQEGAFALILSNQIHAVRTEKASHMWICGFSTDFLPDFHKKVQNQIGDTCVFSCDRQILQYLQKEIFPYEDHLGDVLDRYKLKGSLYLLCAAYLDSVSLTKRDRSQLDLMNTIYDYIEMNYDRKLGLQDVATELGYDYSYFSRLFRKIFLVPFPEFLNNYRCSAAVELIRNSELSLTVIAKQSGFQSIRTFNSVFVRHMGMTPSQYIKQLKNKEEHL